MGFIIIIVFIVAIIAFAVKVFFWIFVAKSAYNAYQVYNYQVEDALQQLSIAMQSDQYEQVQVQQQAVQQQVDSLPRSEREVYESRLSEVVAQRKVLNPATGEWENA